MMSLEHKKHWKFLKFWKSPAYEKICNEWNHWCHPQKILPNPKVWFRALELTKPKDVKVVILGQDPYPKKGYAHGLAFSVMPHVNPLPGSLRNILTEYSDDLGYPEPLTGDLSPWASRGVLLLNSILTVEEGKPLSHQGKGWEKLTYEIIRALDEEQSCVFILWGNRAQEYAGAIQNCPLLTGAHPSPRNNAKGGFFGGKYFSQANEHLKAMGRTPVDWRLPS